ncbi:MAG: hypothetical protein IKQ40_00610, partial [Lachnospiraceae bacterium]|nr:hypothetical protein [Lachnospiraceae bacterium]
DAKIGYLREHIRSSVAMDNIRWYRSDGYDGLIAWPQEGGGYSFDYSYDTQVDLFRDWITRRYSFLDEVWADAGR